MPTTKPNTYRTTHAAGTHPDPTADAQHVAAAAQERAASRMQMVLESVPVAMVVIDRQGRIALLNAEAAHTFRSSERVLVGERFSTLFPERLHADLRRLVGRDANDRDDLQLNILARRMDQQEFPTELRARPCELDGDGACTLVVVSDITTRVQDQAEIARLTERLQLATSGAKIGVWDWDISNDVLTWDDNMFTLYGIDAAQFGSAYDAWARGIHPEDRPAVERKAQAAIEGRCEYTMRFRIVRPDGETRFIATSAVAARPVPGQPATRLVGVNWDVTEEEVALRKLRQSNTELEHFAAIASHDLQEPLRMVANYTELLAKRYRGQLDAKADQYLHFATDGARRMQAMIRDLLAYSRVGSQGKPFAPVVMQDVVTNALRNLEAVILEAGATVTVAPLPVVQGDAGQLLQLLQNLVANAIKFRSDRAPVVQLGARYDAGQWTVTVSDNGIGIDLRFADRIFDMFQRLHGRDAYEGSGLGLSIARKIVERHQGRIWIESELGVGTTFYFTLLPAGASVSSLAGTRS